MYKDKISLDIILIKENKSNIILVLGNKLLDNIKLYILIMEILDKSYLQIQIFIIMPLMILLNSYSMTKLKSINLVMDKSNFISLMVGNRSSINLETQDICLKKYKMAHLMINTVMNDQFLQKYHLLIDCLLYILRCIQF